MAMAGGGLWRKTLVYFGLADEDDEYYDDLPSVRRDEEPSYRDTYRDRDRDRDRAKVRRIPERDSRSRRPSSDFDEIFTEDEYRDERPTPLSQQRSAPLRSVPGGLDRPQVKVHLVMPKNFNDAQVIADKYKNDTPVILNLQQSDTELAKRLIDFASGLTYALDGGMQRVADKVFLLTPRNVEVSAEERQRMLERGFFNQY
jgi:cell division inhibitor SepF